MKLQLTPRPVADSVDELLAGAQRREPFHPTDSRSATSFERIWIDDEPLIVKYLHLDDDFPMRASGDIGCRPLRAYAAGLYDLAPNLIDHGIIGMARGVGRNGWGSAILMRDLAVDLVPEGDAPFTEAQHVGFVDHLAGMCAASWGWHDDLDLLPYGCRWDFFGSAAIDTERALGWPERVPAIAAEGWARFAERVAPRVGEAVEDLRHDISPLAEALAATPSCFLHGDWKAGNLGTSADGRTVLIDWVYVGEGPACHELGWYLALNRAKLPAGHTKERVITDFRAALESHGVTTDDWWERQLALSMLGTLVQFGWEKALGDEAELAWWTDRASMGLALL